jgi:hypothetical protein
MGINRPVLNVICRGLELLSSFHEDAACMAGQVPKALMHEHVLFPACSIIHGAQHGLRNKELFTNVPDNVLLCSSLP